MSVDALNDFRRSIRGNEAIEAEVAVLLSSAGGIDIAGIVALGERHGFSFTEAEVQTYELGKDDELSDFELEIVSAGAAIEKVELDP
jgi:hypothetical protein